MVLQGDRVGPKNPSNRIIERPHRVDNPLPRCPGNLIPEFKNAESGVRI